MGGSKQKACSHPLSFLKSEGSAAICAYLFFLTAKVLKRYAHIANSHPYVFLSVQYSMK